MEQEPIMEGSSKAVEAMNNFALNMPGDLTKEQLSQALEELDKVPGSGGPDLIAAKAAKIVKVYQEKYGINLL